MFHFQAPNRTLTLLQGFLFLVIPLCGFSQFNLCRNFSVKDGLPSSEVYEMLEESSGYFWFATDMGVSRFNGYEFQNFTTENGLPDNTIYGISEDHRHNIWFRAISGKLSYFNKGHITNLACNDSLSGLLRKVLITSIYIDAADTIWLGVTGTFVIRIAPGRTKRDLTKIDLPGDGMYIYEIDSNFVFGGGSIKDQLVTIYRNGRNVVSINQTAPFIKKPRYSVRRLKDQSYLATIDHRIINFNADSVLDAREGDHLNICVWGDDRKDLLIGTYNGVKVFNEQGLGRDHSFKTLDQKIITALHQDQENELWICTKGHGIFYIPYKNFKYYTPETGLPESSISSLSVIDGKVMAGHLDGKISVFNKDAVTQVYLQNKDSIGGKGNEVSSLLDFSADLKFIGTINYIYRYNPINHTTRLIHNRGTKKLIRSGNNMILSLGFGRLREYLSLPEFKRLDTVELSVYSDNIYQDAHETLWICSVTGLWTYNRQQGLVYAGKHDSLLASRIVDLKEDARGFIWMASRGEGVIIKKGKAFIQIKQKNGLSGNMCRTLFLDSANVIWVGTNNGLNKITVESYEPFRYSVKTYTSKNGLLTNEVNHIVKLKNELWLAHNNGISVFDPEHMQDNTSPPPVYITEVLVNEKKISAADAIGLEYNENYLTINYNGLSYKDPGHLDYKYKLIGLDTNWIYTNYTSVNFQSLPYGSYLFVVYAGNNDGYWSSLPAVFRFVIAPAWWQTWWFRGLAALVVVAIAAALFMYRLKVIKRRERLKMIQRARLSNAELKALRSQMNPHFVFNAINSVQYFMTTNDPVSSQKYLSKFAKLIRYVVDNSKPAAIPLNKELEALRLYLDLETLRFENKFDYVIELSDEVDVEKVQIPSMLIQPFVENAIWHGLMHKETKGTIRIGIEYKEKALLCVIEDNGIGRKRSAEINRAKNGDVHRSVGMSITKERLDIINLKHNSHLTMTITDMEDDKGNSTGTRVELNLPFY